MKNLVKRIKIEATEREKLLEIHISDKRHLSRIYSGWGEYNSIRKWWGGTWTGTLSERYMNGE